MPKDSEIIRLAKADFLLALAIFTMGAVQIVGMLDQLFPGLGIKYLALVLVVFLAVLIIMIRKHLLWLLRGI